MECPSIVPPKDIQCLSLDSAICKSSPSISSLTKWTLKSFRLSRSRESINLWEKKIGLMVRRREADRQRTFSGYSKGILEKRLRDNGDQERWMAGAEEKLISFFSPFYVCVLLFLPRERKRKQCTLMLCWTMFNLEYISQSFVEDESGKRERDWEMDSDRGKNKRNNKEGRNVVKGRVSSIWERWKGLLSFNTLSRVPEHLSKRRETTGICEREIQVTQWEWGRRACFRVRTSSWVELSGLRTYTTTPTRGGIACLSVLTKESIFLFVYSSKCLCTDVVILEGWVDHPFYS